MSLFEIRFNRQKADLVENGFFIMADGRRSCDVAVKTKPVVREPVAPRAVKTRDRGTQTGEKTKVVRQKK